MKLTALAEASMWLPGFAPGEDPIEAAHVAAEAVAIEEAVSGPRTFAHRVVVPKKQAKAVWPALTSDVFEGLGGLASKLDANMAAIELAASVTLEGREPTSEERVVLNRYTGWGGIPKVFDQHIWDADLTERQTKLKELLGEERFASARAAVNNSHYTDVSIVEAIWATVQRLGFKGGRILEPSAGTGYFLGAMPQEIAQNSTITAVEIDSVSSDVLKALYEPYGVKVHTSGLEDVALPEGVFDLAISNVPFGNYQVPDTRKVPYADFLIHDYFLARMLDVVRPGGLVVAITSTGTMDKQNPAVRQYLAGKAELLGAVRLPNTAFTAIANTNVTTDVLIFQKRSKPFTGELPDWTDVPVEVSHNDPAFDPHSRLLGRSIHVNALFAGSRGPERVVGQLGVKSGQYGATSTVVFKGERQEFLNALSEKLGAVDGAYVPRDQVSNEREADGRAFVVAATRDIRPGSFLLTDDGDIAVSEGTSWRIVQGLPQRRMERIVGMIAIRDSARKLIAAQVSSEDDGLVTAYRTELGALYDAYVAKYGYLHTQGNSLAFREDPEYPLLLSLEMWDAETQIAEKADIFYRRTVGRPVFIDRCDTPEEALLVSMAQVGEVRPSLIASLTEIDEASVMAYLMEEGAVFEDPISGRYLDRGEYLSGNVKQKLAEARAVGEGFDANVDALLGVIPADIGPGDISLKLGATWVEAGIYKAFISEIMGANPHVFYNSVLAQWRLEYTSGSGVALTQTYGTDRVNGLKLVEYALNGLAPKVTDLDPSDPERRRRVLNSKETLAAREKLESLREAFAAWAWKCPVRSEVLVRAYNDQFNCHVPRTFDGSHLTLPGFSMAYSLYKHQKDAVWRVASSGKNTLLGHVVGAGKTLTMICAGMEQRRMGLAKKPCFVVPNHMLEQFAAEFLRAYPGARVLMASKDDLAKEKRQVLLSRIATGDWDAVLITHSSLERIPLEAGFVKEEINKVVREIEFSIINEKDGTTVKNLERLKKVWINRMAKMAKGKEKDDLLTFDQLGIDSLFVDEFHLFKNLSRISRMRMSGLPTSDSFRAFDMWLKTRHVMASRPDGAGVVAATGTPISNSVAEMWVVQHFLQPQDLEEAGLGRFDAWAMNFGEAVTALELSPDGSSYRMHERFSRFVNVPELMTLFKEVADIKTAEQLNLPTPDVKRVIEVLPCSPELKEYIAGLVERAEAIKKREVTPQEDNMLAVTGDGRRAALDVRLAGIPKGEHQGKVDKAVENILRIYQQTRSTLGTQLVFLDLSTPGANWNLYDEIRRLLCMQGVPRDEVAFIHEHDSDKAKEKLYQAVRDGRVRVLLGSTSKLGCGTNVQTRLVALHHLDAPWRPSDVEQREGRIIRQGNLNGEVTIYRYVTEASFDVYVWQLLEQKAKFIAQVIAGDCSVRSMEDVELAALSYAEVKALASGNPMIITKAAVDAELMKLGMLRSRWLDQRVANQRDVADLPGRIARLQESIAEVEADVAEVPDTRGDKFAIVVRGKAIQERTEAATYLEARKEMLPRNGSEKVATIGPFELHLIRSRIFNAPVEMFIVGRRTYDLGPVGKTGLGTVARLENALKGLPDELDRRRQTLGVQQRRLADLMALSDGEFEHEQRYRALVAQKAEIDEALGLLEGEQSVDVEDDVALAA